MDSKHSIAWAIGVLCLLAACDSRAAYGAPPSDPCSLLTPAQVSAVLDAQVGAGKRVAPTLCDWRALGQPMGMKAKSVMITLLDARGFAATKMQLNVKGITKVPVSGVGDEAVYGTTAGLGSTLSVKKGDIYFVVRVNGFPFDKAKGADEVEAKEKTLALQILSKV
jgi:hypothetical protein